MDKDPGSGAFFTLDPRSGNAKKSGSGICNLLDPGSGKENSINKQSVRIAFAYRYRLFIASGNGKYDESKDDGEV